MLKILIAEDDADLCAQYKADLEKDGHRIVCTPSALGAVDALLAETFDLVLLDYTLEGTLTGLEVAKYISWHCALMQMTPPVVFLCTGHTLERLRGAAIRNPLEGVSFIFYKGQEPSHLYRAINDIDQGVIT